MAVVPTFGRRGTDLLEGLTLLDDPVHACSLVLEHVAGEGGHRRALIAVRHGDRLHGVGWGVPDALLNRFLTDGGEGAEELVRLIRGTGVAQELEGARFLQPLGLSRSVVLPVPGRGGESFGVVLIEGGSAARAAAGLAPLLHRCGPALERVVETHAWRSRAEKLSHQTDLLTDIVDTLADPVLLTDPQNNILLANRRAEQLFSAASGDSEGRRRAVQINNLLFTSFLTQAVIGEHPSASRELNLVDPSDGSDLLFEVISIPASGLGAKVERAVVSILRDITDLKRAVTELEAQFGRSRAAELQARRERDRLNAILENVSDPILVTDDQSNLIMVNREAERLFVVPAPGEGETPARRRVRANDTRFTTLISDFLLQPVERRVERLELTDPESGRTFPGEAVSSKILNRRGETTAIVTIIHDLTQVVENQRLARELRQLNEGLEDRIRKATYELAERNQQLEWQSRELEKASRLKSEFLANMSHELRTPINALLGYTALMQERIYGELTPRQELALEKIRTASRHLLELINDVLDLSKIEAGKMQVHLDRVALPEIAYELSETIQPLVSEKGLSFESEIAEDAPIVQTDRTKLKQILLNLLSNAVKFTNHGSVSLHIQRCGPDGVRITVQDTGIGIAPDQLQTIFEEFRQVDGSHTREYGGTGLGLSITRKLIDLLGGTICVASDPGRGSRFTVDLPTVWRSREP